MDKNERRNRKNKQRLISLVLILLIVIINLLNVYIFNKYNNQNSFNEIENSNNEVKKLENKLDELKLSLDKYTNTEKYIKIEKEKFINNAKKLESKISDKKSNKKIAYLTFDDGPYYNTYKVLEILEENDVKATFFTTNINGERCYDKKSENCRVMYNEYLKYGHTIANHTYTHGIKYGLYSSSDSFINAVTNQENLIKDETNGYITNIVRFPGGSSTARNLKGEIIEKLREKGYGWVDWTAQDGDGGNLQTIEQARNIFYKSIDEDIEVILFHDYNSITTSLLPEFIKYLKDNNYILLPLFYESIMINK